jgi:amidase
VQFLDIREISRLLESKEVSPVELAGLMLERIAILEPRLHSYAYIMPESAMSEARAAEAEILRGDRRGPLHGVPLAVKDQCWTAGVPTAAGTTVLQDNIPTRDAAVVRRLREAGAIILGKLSMAEAAFGDHHPNLPAAVNPWDAETWVGSSSSGAGAATAAGMCYGAIGTDTGGSIRFPSAANGLTGFKPTWGRVSMFGIEGSAGGTMDHVGPIARSAYDCATMLKAIAGDDVDDPTTLLAEVPDYPSLLGMGIRGLRIGVDPEFNSDCDRMTLNALLSASEVFQNLGALVVEVSIPDVSGIVGDWKAACAIDLALAHERNFPSRRVEYGPEIAAMLDFGRSKSATDLRRILQEQQKFQGRLERLFTDVDVLLVPVTGIASPTTAQMAEIGYGRKWQTLVMHSTCPFNISGSPALVLPGGFTERGAPVGIQLVGAHLSEQVLLRAAHEFQQVTNYHRRHPSL